MIVYPYKPSSLRLLQPDPDAFENAYIPQASWPNSLVNHPDDRIQLDLYFFRTSTLPQETAEYPDPTR